jgi:hypothetical protein
VFNKKLPAPEKIDVTILPPEITDRFLKCGNCSSSHPKDFKELIPEGLRFSVLPSLSFPFPGEMYCPLFNFSPIERHCSNSTDRNFDFHTAWKIAGDGKQIKQTKTKGICFPYQFVQMNEKN